MVALLLLGLCPEANEVDVTEYLEAVRRGVQLGLASRHGPPGRGGGHTTAIQLLGHYKDTMRRMFRQASTGRRVKEWVNERGQGEVRVRAG